VEVQEVLEEKTQFKFLTVVPSVIRKGTTNSYCL